MYINSRVDFPVDVGRRKTRVLNVELNSYDENSHIFEISFLDIELDDTYEVNVLSYFEESDRTAYFGTEIRDGVAVFMFDTDLISMDEKVTNYVYLKKGDYQIEVNSFRVNVNLSKIDEKAVTVAKAYDNKYDALLKDFELAIKKYRDSLPSSEEILEDVGETIRKLEELNNSFGFQEEERVNKESERVSSESIRDESERERVAHEETRIQNEQKREEDELNRKSSEDSRLVSEQERKSSEEERIISEQMRTSAEEEREVSELTRRDSEQERVENESIRAQSEQSREEGEAERVISEDARESSELERMVAEGERARGETIREVGERERVLNESIRKTAEEERVEREDARADLYELVKQRLADGEFIGEKGDTGDGLEYVWSGTQLGVRKEGETEYVYVDLKGDKGDQGIQGERGPQGIQGLKGDKGDKGDKGNTGDTGPRGPIGPEGPQGEIGPRGPQGTQGIQGPKGDKGDKGDQGIQGVEGPRGLPGEIDTLHATHIEEALGYVPANAEDISYGGRFAWVYNETNDSLDLVVYE